MLNALAACLREGEHVHQPRTEKMRWLVCYRTGRVMPKGCVLGAPSLTLVTVQRGVVAGVGVVGAGVGEGLTTICSILHTMGL